MARKSSVAWLKALILPAAKTHTSRKISAVAMIAGATSGFRFVAPDDEFAHAFRAICLLGGATGFLWLFILLVFPPRG
jgi:hypothetical protein